MIKKKELKERNFNDNKERKRNAEIRDLRDKEEWRRRRRKKKERQVRLWEDIRER